MTAAVAARLAEFQIELVAEAKSYCLFARAGIVAMANRDATGEFSFLGSSGMMTPEGGVAYLVWRGEQALLVSHGDRQIPATAEQVEEIQRFSADLKVALGLVR